ncbi:MAG: PAS domain-containing protein [Bryobacteraceae bacterium]
MSAFTDRYPPELARMLEEPGLPAIGVDEIGIVRDVTAAFESLWDWPRSRVVGLPVGELIPPDFLSAHHAAFSRFVLTGSGSMLDQQLAVSIIDGGGRIVPVEMSLHAGRADAGWRFVAIARAPAPVEAS